MSLCLLLASPVASVKCLEEIVHSGVHLLLGTLLVITVCPAVGG